MVRLLVALFLVVAAFAFDRGCSEAPPPVQTETVEVQVDDALLAADDAFAVIEPVWDRADIYGTHADLERSLAQFSQPQRLMHALHWYIAEVNNGGHYQFFYNSTGILWPEVLAAFDAIGANAGAEILREAISRLGGSPSRERAERQSQLDVAGADFQFFDDLDTRFYDFQEHVDLNAQMLEFMRGQAESFYFRGTIERAVFPQPGRQ